MSLLQRSIVARAGVVDRPPGVAPLRSSAPHHNPLLSSFALLLLGLVLVLGSIAQGQDWLRLRPRPYEELDWHTWIARSFGEAPGGGSEGRVLSADRANDSMLRLLAGVRIDATATLQDRMSQEEQLAEAVAGRISELARQRRASRADGRLTVRLELDFLAALGALIAPSFGGGVSLVPLICPTCGQHWPETRPFPASVARAPGEATPVTGVVVHVGTLRYEPALFPRLVDLEGREVYGPGFARRDRALESGLLLYALAPEMVESRVGAHPLHIKPLGVRGGCDFVISGEDVRRLHANGRALEVMAECRVIVTSSPLPSEAG